MAEADRKEKQGAPRKNSLLLIIYERIFLACPRVQEVPPQARVVSTAWWTLLSVTVVRGCRGRVSLPSFRRTRGEMKLSRHDKPAEESRKHGRIMTKKPITLKSRATTMSRIQY